MQATFGEYEFRGLFTIVIELQKDISPALAHRDYRVDLLIYLTRWCRGDKQPVWGKVVVEVDGHDFHERSKEQAARNRQRDRDFMMDGYKVVPFTGSEVYNDPYKCAEEISFLLENEASEIFFSALREGRLEELIMGERR
jgi:hypothetical protein